MSEPISYSNPLSKKNTNHYDDLEFKVVEVPNSCAIDQILIRLAINIMQGGGHRYGAFLDAAMTAAKFAIYTTYLSEGKNFRKTGLLHHVEPKRVKTIVQEVESALTEGKLLKTLASQEPYYLIYLPHLWLKKYPWTPPQPRLPMIGLTREEKLEVEASLPNDLPNALVLTEFQFMELIELLHLESQKDSSEAHRVPLSDALIEHIKLRLLYSGTVVQIQSPRGFPFYCLARTSYSPQDKRERIYTMFEDVDGFFQLLQAWVNKEPGVLRGLEVFEVPIERKEEALQELDKLIQAWADKYHQEGGQPMVLHLATGPVKR
ncbi:heterocyst differentiation control protein [Oscillatoria sp. FACHB-1407]|uniref:heterocyst differentiation control protein n=1 Tax=Oscillatoria sp. FACHB-1407 TaxID=2692847 RepID=UPI00168A22B1|nr:heterocyst differentiation control protein [Oscillatoria sp. FACHB-1407]MBD2461502.1 heterocyst differentiation control protein [Oscillatoria sp. FACHB-1407]